MDIKNIIVVSTDQTLLRNLESRLDRVPEIKGTYISYPPEARKILQSQGFDCLIIEDSVTKKDIEQIFEDIERSNIHKNAPMIFKTKDFSVFRDILNKHPNFNIRIIDIPVQIEDLAASIQDLVFPKSTRDNQGDFANNKYPVDLDFLRIFIEASHKSIGDMTGVKDITFLKPFILGQLKEKIDIGIMGRVLIRSNLFTGAFYLAFPEKTYLSMCATILGESDEKINADNADFAGELVNIVYGQAKKRLNDNGYALNMAIPEILLGNHRILDKHLVIVTPFKSPFGDFYVKIVPNMVF